MRKKRLTFWVVSLIICAVSIVICQKVDSKIPEEKKETIKVYCYEPFKEQVKKVIKKSSLSETHKVTFINNKDDAELIFTDKILASDKGYEKIGWSPLVVVFEDKKAKIKSYKEEGYIAEEEKDEYSIKFDKIIKAALKGEWKEKIYCPKADTREGELFFDFLLINLNGGIYPRNEKELQDTSQKANQFLNTDVVVQVDSIERLKSRKVVKNEFFITFENDLYKITDNKCKYKMAYPSNTVIHEWYWKVTGKNQKSIKKCYEKKKMLESGTRIQDMLYRKHIRNNRVTSYDYNVCDVYDESSGFSYVEIPLREE